jgi:hypothetical protein
MAPMRANGRRTIEIRFATDGDVWRQVASLARSGPNDNHYTVRTDARGRTILTFGDGVHGRRPPTGSPRLITTYRPARRYTMVIMQRGRVILDRDFNEDDTVPNRWCGVFAGVVVNSTDPQSLGRLQVRIPAVLGARSVWAAPCVPAGSTDLPAVHQPVWIVFQAGDPSQPVWIGTMWQSPPPLAQTG